MNVTFEHPTIIFDNKIAEVIIEFVNHILYADSEETLRQIVADFADKYDLDRYFVYGYGSHHLWLKQRKITNPDITFEYRILIVEYYKPRYYDNENDSQRSKHNHYSRH